MPSVQPVVSEQQILQLLGRHFSGAVNDVAIVTGGEVARTVGFSAEGQVFILRLVTKQMGATYEKEARIRRRLVPRVPIPRVLHVGRFEDWNYAISERVPGKPLVQHTWEENEQLLPQLIEVVHAIHETNISDTHGYGVFDDQEVGMCAYSASTYFFALPRTGIPTNNRNYCASTVVIAFARLFDVRYSPELHGCYLTTAMECHAHTWKP
jgi:hygromycin-B 4-O-kinase